MYRGWGLPPHSARLPRLRKSIFKQGWGYTFGCARAIFWRFWWRSMGTHIRPHACRYARAYRPRIFVPAFTPVRVSRTRLHAHREKPNDHSSVFEDTRNPETRVRQGIQSRQEGGNNPPVFSSFKFSSNFLHSEARVR